jgi:acetyl esterase/lipase
LAPSWRDDDTGIIGGNVMDRRTALGLSAASLAALSLRADAEEPVWSALQPDPKEVIPLWPADPPGARSPKPELVITERSTAPSEYLDRAATGIAVPTLTVFRPKKPDGSALLIAPGGGYKRVVIDKEGFEAARRLNAAGVTCFVLLYRLPGEGWASAADVPLQDAQRAMRVIRAQAQGFAIDPARLGVLGFSAGGHVAASLATRYAAQVYAPVDTLDSADAKPVFAGLMYPVITMDPQHAHMGSRHYLLGDAASAAQEAAHSCEKLVDANTPPTWLAAAQDDKEVPLENTLSMFASLRAAHVPTEMHIFEEGGHGFGLRKAQGLPAAYWPDLLLHWMTRRGYVRGA